LLEVEIPKDNLALRYARPARRAELPAKPPGVRDDEPEVPSRMFSTPEQALIPRDVAEMVAQVLTVKQRAVLILYAAEYEPVEIAALMSGEADQEPDEVTGQRGEFLAVVDQLVQQWRGPDWDGGTVSKQAIAKTIHTAQRKLREYRNTKEVSK
jgi:hypothetical protein